MSAFDVAGGRRALELLAGEPDAKQTADLADLVSRLRANGVRRIEFVAWRDLDDPEAGGSELHSHRIASQWAEAGLDVAFRTSSVPGSPEATSRSGYRVVRRSGRYGVFPAVAYEGFRGIEKADALVEIWNGMPFFAPLWFRGPRIVFLHHVHAEMWRMVLPRSLAALGRGIESVLAPLVYRRSTIVTLSESSRSEIVSMLGIPARRVWVAAPGVDPRFRPEGPRSPVPLVVAVGRLVPVKRFDLLIAALSRTKQRHPRLRAVIIGEGYERNRLEDLRRRVGAEQWLELPGRVDETELLSWYRRAWLVASTSLREGWGMTLTEAGACRTPSVATRIAGHLDAVVDKRTGLLADGVDEIAGAMSRLLSDEALRRRLGRAAESHSRGYTWGATAARTLERLADESDRVSSRRRIPSPPVRT